MPFNTSIRSALQKDSPAFGFWLWYVFVVVFLIKILKTSDDYSTANLSISSLNNASAAKTFLRAGSQSPTGGFSWVLVDAEHGLITDRDYYEAYFPRGSCLSFLPVLTRRL